MKKRVLIFIDNNIHIVDIFKNYFFHCPVFKLFFGAPEDFMEWKEKNKVEYKYIIVSDYHMINIDGLELLNSVKEKDAVKIIFSNFCESKAIEEAVLNNKIDAFFPKGYVSSLEQLRKLVKEHI